MMKHEQVQENLTGFVLRELGNEQNHQIQKHLSKCDPCRQEAQRMRKVLETADCLKAEQVDEQSCRQARQNLLDAVEEMETEDGSSEKRWWTAPFVQYAAAAVLILGALLALHYLGPDQKLPDAGNLTTYTRQEPQPVRLTEPMKALEKELQTAAHFFEAGNVQGLAVLLQSGQEETKRAAAHYLAQIGDESVLDSLEILSSQWEGDPQDNPYQQAIEAIRKRQPEQQNQ